MVNVRFAAANRDEREFDDPDQIDLERAKPADILLRFGCPSLHWRAIGKTRTYWAFHALVHRIEDMKFYLRTK